MGALKLFHRSTVSKRDFRPGPQYTRRMMPGGESPVPTSRSRFRPRCSMSEGLRGPAPRARPSRARTTAHRSIFGLHFYGYRWSDPVTGRWVSRDPIEERGGLNLYGLVGNDAIGRIDALGRDPFYGPTAAPGTSWGVPGSTLHPDNFFVVETLPDPVRLHCMNDGFSAGYYRHCVNSCRFQLVVGIGALTQIGAQTYGGDLPWQSHREAGDIAGNQKGIDVANRYGRSVSCVEKCRLAFYARLRRDCCRMPGKEFLNRNDPRCCETNDELTVGNQDDGRPVNNP